MSHRPRSIRACAIVGATCLVSLPAVGPAAAQTATPPRTESAITAADLRVRLGAYADDSMLGREAGTIGAAKATAYIAAELDRLGLTPMGDDGTFFQTVPLVSEQRDSATSVRVGGTALALWKDFVPLPPIPGVFPFSTDGSFDDVEAVYAGQLGKAPVLTPEQAEGKLIVYSAPIEPNGNPSFQIWATGGLDTYPNAAAIAVATLDITPGQLIEYIQTPTTTLADAEAESEGPVGMLISRRAAERLFRQPLDRLLPRQVGPRVSIEFRTSREHTEAPARNVVALVEGSDPAMRNQYVAIGAHSDHVGLLAGRPADHDSVLAYNTVVRPMGAESPTRPATQEEQARIRAIRDSLAAIRPDREDSVFNGADDDGSGSVALLELAEYLSQAAERPKRSILLVWHTAEELGLFGSQYFTDHPTVPRDSIVAQINVDMIGRGSPADIEDGGPGYLQILGSRRLSTEFGDLVEEVNTRDNHGFTFDYQYDADGHPEQYYCRSDHYMYARYGIPIVFFSTGSHRDYHMLTDEPEYIDYDKLAAVTRFVLDLAQNVADLDHRPVVDKPRPDPHAPCVQ